MGEKLESDGIGSSWNVFAQPDFQFHSGLSYLLEEVWAHRQSALDLCLSGNTANLSNLRAKLPEDQPSFSVGQWKQ